MNGYTADLPAAIRAAPKDLYFYGVNFAPPGTTLAASAIAQSASFQIEQDSAYIIMGINRLLTTNADAVVNPNFSLALIMIRDSGSGRNLMNVPVPLDNITGGAQAGGPGGVVMQYPFPKLLGPNSVVTVELTNLEATARNIRLTFWGYKVYRSINMQPALSGF